MEHYFSLYFHGDHSSYQKQIKSILKLNKLKYLLNSNIFQFKLFFFSVYSILYF